MDDTSPHHDAPVTDDAPRAGTAARRRRRGPGRLSPVLVAVSVLIALVAAAGVYVALGGGGSNADDEAATGELTKAETVPERSFPTFGGEDLSMAEFAGRPVVVNFFSSTCAPCVDEMPAFEQVHTDLGKQVAFVGINVADNRQAGMDLVEQTGVSYLIGEDPTGELMRDFGGTLLPTTALVGPDGTILDSHSGALTADELRAKISGALLGGG